MPSTHPSQIVEFRVRAANKNQSADEVRRLLDEAVAEAVAESADVESARAEMLGAFAGVGETLIVVAIFLGKAAAGGVAGAAGKHFYESVLRPKLQKKNLLASDAKVRDADREGSGEA